MTKLYVSVLLLLVSVNAFAADQYIINTAKYAVVVGYEVCEFKPGENNGSRYKCTNNNITVPANGKVMAPWPEATVRTNAYLLNLTTPTGAFNPVKFLSHAERIKACGSEDATPDNVAGCAELPIYLGRAQKSFASSASQGPGLGGAWVIQDFGVTGFITMKFHPLGASHARS